MHRPIRAPAGLSVLTKSELGLSERGFACSDLDACTLGLLGFLG